MMFVGITAENIPMGSSIDKKLENKAIVTLALCFTTVTCVFHSSFGKCRFIISPNTAVSTQWHRPTAIQSKYSIKVNFITTANIVEQITSSGAVIKIFSRILLLKISISFIGNDLRIHKFLPSRETDGDVVQVNDTHMTMDKVTNRDFGTLAGNILSKLVSFELLIISSTVIIGIIIAPKPVLTTYICDEK